MSTMTAETARVTRPPDAFAFGRNWQRYVAEHLDEERAAIAAKSLADLLEIDLAGKVFVDIGAGSGLFSLCAHRAGAARVVSIDVDPDSVASCEALRQAAGEPEGWLVREASILDPQAVAELPRADVVYSWGVLHHTGDMETAIRNAARLVEPGGIFCIAIYNRVTGRFLDSERWRQIKRRYNHSPRLVQRALELAYTAYWGWTQLRSRRNPFRTAREYRASRGMALTTDLVDWLGGYPYEYATVEEIVEFCERACGLETVKVVPLHPQATGNNEFVFRRPSP
jgi:SAM-dependent methyltransferase